MQWGKISTMKKHIHDTCTLYSPKLYSQMAKITEVKKLMLLYNVTTVHMMWTMMSPV